MKRGEEHVGFGSECDGAQMPKVMGDSAGLGVFRAALVAHCYGGDLMAKLAIKTGSRFWAVSGKHDRAAPFANRTFFVFNTKIHSAAYGCAWRDWAVRFTLRQDASPRDRVFAVGMH